MNKILFVTGNAGKLREVAAILTSSSPGAFELVSQDIDMPEIQGTTQEVAAAKVKAAAQVIQGPCITEVRPDELERAQRGLSFFAGHGARIHRARGPSRALHQGVHEEPGTRRHVPSWNGRAGGG